MRPDTVVRTWGGGDTVVGDSGDDTVVAQVKGQILQ